LTKVLLLAGGTGSSKLIRGFQPFLEDFAVIANVGDNVWMHGLYVCPDLDIAMYTLAGMLDLTKGWGVDRDSYSVLGQLGRLGEQSWFTLGDRDLATHILRTELLGKGMRLTQVTALLSARLRVRQGLLPPTDDHVETRVITPSGDLHLQEFWVRDHGAEDIKSVGYAGIEKAGATREAIGAILDTDRIILCPANPVTSIMPILKTPGIREALLKTGATRIALSPFVGDRPFSGPAGKFMSALGMESNSVSLARLYRGVVDRLVIDSSDERMKGSIEREGLGCTLASTAMNDQGAQTRVARLLLEA
jgi:LPPG:FO 2-phospho-L-lactate transferase